MNAIQPSTNTTRTNELIKGILVERYQRTCQYCGVQSESYTQGPDGFGWVADHVIPRIKGGGDGLENRALSCFACNCSKRDREVAEWQAKRASRPKGQPVTLHPALAQTYATQALRKLSYSYHRGGLALGEIARAFRITLVSTLRDQVPAELIVMGKPVNNVSRESAILIISHLSGIALEDLPPVVPEIGGLIERRNHGHALKVVLLDGGPT